ncbi:MAG: hypothetical protein A2W91_04295 [Bacteroidetes bacterium GWF2_38_335]|nr:MAG: hypothetical protein A2W91_04295 [Bacteroidetes bacterium GWF2_38_335]HBS88272.1 hypothetical protein [Bacteroidales bacterium]
MFRSKLLYKEGERKRVIAVKLPVIGLITNQRVLTSMSYGNSQIFYLNSVAVAIFANSILAIIVLIYTKRKKKGPKVPFIFKC